MLSSVVAVSSIAATPLPLPSTGKGEEVPSVLRSCGAQWRDDGFFCAPRKDGDLVVKGVASDVEVVAEVLRRTGVLQTSRSVHRARPNDEVNDWGWTAEASAEAQDFDAELSYRLGPGRPDCLAGQLLSIAAALPRQRGDLEEMAQQRAGHLNRHAPQVHAHRLFVPVSHRHEGSEHGVPNSAHRGWGVWTEWIDPILIISTPSRTWNDIDRNPRRSTVVDVAVWLQRAAESAADLDAWLAKMFVRRLDSIRVRPIHGPAGPLYELMNGTHRIHAARIWGLPVVLAKVLLDQLPVPIYPGPGEDLTPCWKGLQRRGLLAAEVDDGGQWLVHSVVAEWMLTAPKLATRMNAIYERIYPAALQQATGMSYAELCEPRRWEHALTRC